MVDEIDPKARACKFDAKTNEKENNELSKSIKINYRKGIRK